MNDPASLSAFLRASAAGQKPVPTADVRDTQRKYGFGGKLPKAIMISLLAAFAVSPALGHDDPLVTAFAAGVLNPPPARARVETPAPRPAVTAPANALSESQVMDKVHDYKPMPVPEGCVVNSLLFEDWFKDNLPGNWSKQAVVQVRMGRGGGRPVHHRIVLFQAGENFYAYDQSYGALPLDMGKKGSPERLVEMVERARYVCEAALTGQYGRLNLGEQPQKVDKEEVKGDIYMAVQRKMAAHRPAAVVDYQGKRALAFREEGKIGVYERAAGTVQGKLLQPNMADEALRQMMGALFGGNGDYRVAQGSITPSSASQDEVIAMHALPSPSVGQAKATTPAPASMHATYIGP